MLRHKRVWIISGIVAVVVLRVLIVVSWHAPAGDGIQYYQLAQELRRDHRFAFAAPPAPLSFSRLPGYPLFLAFVAAPGKAVSLERHLRAATVWNVVFDSITALLLFLAARAAGLRRAWFGGALVLLWPTLWLMSCYALTESLSLLANAAQLYLAVEITRQGKLRHVAAAGAITGLALLIRFDAVCAAPMVVYACLGGALARGQRLRLVGVYLGITMVVFSPWPVRNMIRFGRPYFAATTWRMSDGKPLREGPVQWARTWADSAIGDSYFELYFVYGVPMQIERPGNIKPKLYDSEEERLRLVRAYEHYNRDGLSEDVNEEFVQLARDRLRQHPLRTVVVLPLKRLLHLFIPEPEYEMPMRIKWLALPRLRGAFLLVDLFVYALAAVGAVLGWRSQHRRLVILLLLPMLARFAVYAFAIPQATTQRYLVEAFPSLLMLATIGLWTGAAYFQRSTSPPRGVELLNGQAG